MPIYCLHICDLLHTTKYSLMLCSIFRKQSEQITFGKSIINLIFRWKSFTIPNEINACFCSEIPQQNPTPIILKKIDEYAVLFTHNTYRILVFNILHITNIYHILCSESYIFCSASFITNKIKYSLTNDRYCTKYSVCRLISCPLFGK